MMQDFPHYNPIQIFFHKSFYKLNYWHARLFKSEYSFIRPNLDAQQSSDLILDMLESNKPCMIARYGATELYCLSNYMGIQKGWKNAIDFICGVEEPWWWVPERVNNMRENSGFFPIKEESLNMFCETMLEDTKQLDILASWLSKEKNVEHLLSDKPKIFLPYLEPWYASDPWTVGLEGKRIVVVHPFAEQIYTQYKNFRSKLFEDNRILPKFELKTLKAVQSLGGTNSQGFQTWFEALDWMKEELDRIEYDIALIGCGAYGFPLAAHVKRTGKKAIHMGGVLQLFFGIKGNRWEDPMYGVREWGLPEGYYLKLFNQWWIKPDESTKPKNAEQVEGACYW